MARGRGGIASHASPHGKCFGEEGGGGRRDQHIFFRLNISLLGRDLCRHSLGNINTNIRVHPIKRTCSTFFVSHHPEYLTKLFTCGTGTHESLKVQSNDIFDFS